VIMNTVFGSKFDIVSGYKVSGDVSLAIERGEVQGRWAGHVQHQENASGLGRRQRLNLLLAFGFKRHRNCRRCRLCSTSPRTKTETVALSCASSRAAIRLALVAPPASRDKIAILRRLYATMEDKESC